MHSMTKALCTPQESLVEDGIVILPVAVPEAFAERERLDKAFLLRQHGHD
jgi:hypothetical protein